MRNLHRRFDRYYIGQIYGGDFAKFYGLLRIYELYILTNFLFDGLVVRASVCQTLGPGLGPKLVKYVI